MMATQNAIGLCVSPMHRHKTHESAGHHTDRSAAKFCADAVPILACCAVSVRSPNYLHRILSSASVCAAVLSLNTTIDQLFTKPNRTILDALPYLPTTAFVSSSSSSDSWAVSSKRRPIRSFAVGRARLTTLLIGWSTLTSDVFFCFLRGNRL